jgi:hypothetical protein
VTYSHEVARAEGLRQSAYKTASVEADRITAEIDYQRRLLAAAVRNSVINGARERLRELNADSAGKLYQIAHDASPTIIETDQTETATLVAVSQLAADNTRQRVAAVATAITAVRTAG